MTVTTQDWRSRKRDETHQRIYETAMRLFGEQGFENVSVAQIAAAAGVSVPTFYAHYASKEHVVFLPVPSTEEITALLRGLPPGLPTGERIQRLVLTWIGQVPPPVRADVLARWHLVLTTPGLRLRAAEFERNTAEVILAALASLEGGHLPPTDRAIANAYLAAFTSAFLAWADENGQREMEDIIEESFRALQ